MNSNDSNNTSGDLPQPIYVILSDHGLREVVAPEGLNVKIFIIDEAPSDWDGPPVITAEITHDNARIAALQADYGEPRAAFLLMKWREKLAEIKATHAELASSIFSKIIAFGSKSIEVGDFLDSACNELKGILGACAANDEADSEDQERMIELAAQWVTDNVSNGTEWDRISAVIWVEQLPDLLKLLKMTP